MKERLNVNFNVVFLASIHVPLLSTVCSLTSLVAQTVKRLPTMQETQVRPLGWEDTLEKEMATHSSLLAWKIPWTEEPTVHGAAESDTTEHTRQGSYNIKFNH